MELRVGDSVVVKAGVLDPDFDFDIGGWQGRLEEVDDGETVLIRWDSVTLRQMGMDVIVRSENDNLDWQLMTLEEGEIRKTVPRDSEDDVWSTVRELEEEMMQDPRLKPAETE